VVTLNGRDIYLGKWNSKESRTEYDRLICEWLTDGRCLPKPESDLTVAELALRYGRFAQSYYRKDGRPTDHLHAVRQAVRLLREGYAMQRAVDFGPLGLRATQQRLVAAGRARTYVNHLCGVVKRVFKWGASHEMLPVSVYQALATVPGLKQGRSEAHEPAPVRPVTDVVVDATLAYLPLVVADMARFQQLTGCRPGEVCGLRPAEVPGRFV